MKNYLISFYVIYNTFTSKQQLKIKLPQIFLIQSNMISHQLNEPPSYISVVIFVLLLAIMVSGVTYIGNKYDKIIPLAPAGMLATNRNMSGSNAPWFLLDMAKRTNSDIFQLNLPLPGGVYCVGCPDITRKILLDDKTDKPADLY